MMNFDGSFLGPAHSAELATLSIFACSGRTAIQRRMPSTLSETASISAKPSRSTAPCRSVPNERLVLLDTSLERDLAVVVDIIPFPFEKAFSRSGRNAI